ncbi:MAG: FAD-dependent thymidylate synthase [Clostridia bacterium]|jgi:thymidylate synthase (FAD)|uniref:FAD-dependent thymidylate synthase n=1 Tax=Petroclostridium xylanilyticum TaxID=1792311 RepID=UPI000B995E1B|nr:FAD-dependent thymidylate synthase [Petroclostridium xylanilyticum]MBZ4645698.1 FAD-dependent thymidylate synthase [Clostridia bacterium]
METKLRVKLLQYTPEPEKLVASAAKLCYSSSNIEDIMEGLTGEKVNSFLNMLVDIGHESPIEHVSFTFGIEGVSRSLLAQLTRHRIASYSVKSQRYVREGQFEYVIPSEIEAIPEAKEKFIQAMEQDQQYYNELTDILMKKHYQTFINEGKPEKQARLMAEKKAIEDARYVLPNACETKIVLTMNARSLLNFFHHRCCERAQWEIRELAVQMLKLVRKAAPTLFKNAGPKCLAGPCPEGKMSCGRMNEKREFFGSL